MLNWLKRDIKTYRTMPRSHKILLAAVIALCALCRSAMATSDVRVIGPVTVKNAPGTTLNTSTSSVKITDGTDIAEVIAGANTGVKGLRVYGGPTDPISDIPVHIDFDHHQIHEGEAFQTHHIIGSLNAGSAVDYYFKTYPFTDYPGEAPHMVAEIVSTAETEIYYYEAPTFSSTGTALSILNRRRDTPNASLMVVGATATITAPGIELDVALTGSGRAAGESRVMAEWVLKSDTAYGMRVISRVNGDKIIVRFHWYEDKGI